MIHEFEVSQLLEVNFLMVLIFVILLVCYTIFKLLFPAYPKTSVLSEYQLSGWRHRETDDHVYIRPNL